MYGKEMIMTFFPNRLPKLRFTGFEENWENKTLGELLEFKNGINASKEQYGSGVKFINVLDILSNDFITYDNIVGKVNVDEIIVEKFSVSYGDILFQRSSETREEVGTANVYLDKNKNATFGGFVIRGKKIGDYNPIFFNKLLKTNSARENITSKSGGSTRFNVGQEILSSVNLYFPNLSEQDKIASFLSLVDERIKTQKKIIEQLETLMRANREKIFSQKLRFKDDQGNYFSDWGLTELKNVCFITGGGTPDTQKSEFWNGNIQWFTPTEIKSNSVFKSERTISESGLKNSSAKILPQGSILLTTRATIGEVAIAQEECTTNQGFQSLVVKENCNNIFLFHWIKENKFELIRRANGSTFPEISKSKIELIKISLPSLEEQTKIANFLSSIQEKRETEKQILEKLELQKKFLLANLFV
ncbi:restriction endonuclease subunit S [Chryseobacterium camelliae]|uniref:restriction endonuclease subunit S n=1 Tax=Chryseobacterium camelliae TaxID=1265445 RepID=UPI00285DC761|nr:restriction endonuclease subunit S [Chryseobacterium camelliae]MDR6515918.1 type I restriction enzyme S subunit [Chryseobacterium camelliae]